MANFGEVTSWYAIDKLRRLYRKLEAGDLLEFDRGSFQHWAVCTDEEDGKLVHRVGGGAGSGQLVCACQSLDKAAHAIGAVRKGRIEDVLGVFKVRINNSGDNERRPRRQKDIVEFAENAVGKVRIGEYNILTNNCEHFARLCRNGLEQSKQVAGLMAWIKGSQVAGCGLVEPCDDEDEDEDTGVVAAVVDTAAAGIAATVDYLKSWF